MNSLREEVHERVEVSCGQKGRVFYGGTYEGRKVQKKSPPQYRWVSGIVNWSFWTCAVVMAIGIPHPRNERAGFGMTNKIGGEPKLRRLCG